MTSEVDELYSVKTAYWLGNYDEAVQEARQARVKADALKIERDVYMYRAYIAMGQYDVVLSGIKDDPSTPIALQAIKLFATYLAAPPKGREVPLLQLDDWMSDASAASNPVLQYVAGSMYMHQGDVSAALTAIKGGNASLETLGLSVQLYLKLDRHDLAERSVKAMTTADDESALTQLCTATLYLAQGGDKAKEASLIFKDLVDRAGSDPLPLVNGLASSYIAMRRYEDAERILLEAHARAPGHADTLVNLIAVAQQTGRAAEAAGKWLPALREAVAESGNGVPHPYLAQLDALDGAFDRVAASFAV